MRGSGVTFTTKQRNAFKDAVRALRETALGRESTMYTALFSLFVEVLGYSRSSVVIDTSGARGRPDLTIYAPGGTAGSRIAWIVVEAKAEPGQAADHTKRGRLYGEKAKYITADTAYIMMVDPTIIVARGASIGHASADIEVPLVARLTLETFAETLAPLRAEVGGVPAVLGRFRNGDETLIACDKLSAEDGADDNTRLAVRVSRNVFFDSLAETTRLLQKASLQALAAIRPERERIQRLVAEFAAKYGGIEFRPYPISVEGLKRAGYEVERAHRRDAALLRRQLAQEPALARLTLHGLPRFADRTGLDPIKESAKAERFFANETANLILARILLIRFLEDHGFFDTETPDGPARRRYLCNGGIVAFQGMRAYFDHSYTRLLEEAYRRGGHFYSAAFDETEMDWVFALSDPNLSQTIEWAMFRMARFDFRTARGDLMTGIYDRFLDRKQRKEQGEYYTPPSIARYILDQINPPEGAEVLDPACGSGTFLIEQYRRIVGEDADRGLATYEQARAEIERLFGNDLNPFSAVLTQIQLLWHLLTFGPELRTKGVPDIRIAERANSLSPGALFDPSQSRFGEIDRSGYDAVVGNPPYIRPERSQELETQAREYFATARERNGRVFDGIMVSGRNAYSLFIYRALDYWCRQPEQGSPGKLGFIIPLAFCGSQEAGALRALFKPGARWAIREIVDLELIWDEIFDADVLPMIMIAEACPAKDDDEVSIRLADETCVITEEGAKRASFRFDHLSDQHVRYADIFTADGRVLTRLNPERVAILKKLRANARLSDAAMPYWVRRIGKVQEARLDEPSPKSHGASRWKRETLIRYGVATGRREAFIAGGGYDVYKGENITTSRLVGNPVFKNLDPTKAEESSIWQYPAILPETLYAIPVIEQVPVAAPFDPRKIAVLNTAVIFGPRDDLKAVPFDIVLLSRVYAYFYMLAGRRSFQNKLRSHIYPTSVMELPWNDTVAARAGDLVNTRDALLELCERRYEHVESRRKRAGELGMQPLRVVARGIAGTTIERSDAFATRPEFVIEVGEVVEQDGAWRLSLSSRDDAGGRHALLFNDQRLAALARGGLSLLDGEEVSWSAILNANVPIDETMLAQLRELLATFECTALEEQIGDEVARIDDIVGSALGLLPEDIQFIQEDMAADSLLAQVRPRYPFFRPRQHGRRPGLHLATRYRGAA